MPVNGDDHSGVPSPDGAPPRLLHPGDGAGSLLVFAGVSLRARDGLRERALLDGVSFELQAGESFGVYGEPRSGKSALLRLAAGIDVPHAGSVRFAGNDLAELSKGDRERLARGPVALLAPGAWLPTPGETITDYVAVCAGSAGLSMRDARRRAIAALSIAGVAAARAQDTTASLSIAERARVMLAGAIVREPRLLLVDEPAAMFALTQRDRFCALLRSYARENGVALLVASEDIASLQGLDSLGSLADGELCSSRQAATVVEFPRRRASSGERP
jgi:ABC-type glutathione transport system ATPase component